jgi:hypothetical protein
MADGSSSAAPEMKPRPRALPRPEFSLSRTSWEDCCRIRLAARASGSRWLPSIVVAKTIYADILESSHRLPILGKPNSRWADWFRSQRGNPVRFCFNSTISRKRGKRVIAFSDVTMTLGAIGPCQAVKTKTILNVSGSTIMMRPSSRTKYRYDLYCGTILTIRGGSVSSLMECGMVAPTDTVLTSDT